MSDARSEILGKIRTTRSAPEAVKNTLGKMTDRLKDHPANLIPERGKGTPDKLLARFIEEAEKVSATVARVGSDDEIPKQIAKYLADNNLPSRIKQAPALAHLDWSNTLLEVSQGIGEATDEVCVTSAFAGVAETGTLVTYSGALTPTTLNFLPPVHVVVLKASEMVGSYEDVWAKLRARLQNKDHPGAFIPRAVNMITGPSRTGDIQQELLLGIHGPQRLHIVVVDEETP